MRLENHNVQIKFIRFVLYYLYRSKYSTYSLTSCQGLSQTIGRISESVYLHKHILSKSDYYSPKDYVNKALQNHMVCLHLPEKNEDKIAILKR